MPSSANVSIQTSDFPRLKHSVWKLFDVLSSFNLKLETMSAQQVFPRSQMRRRPARDVHQQPSHSEIFNKKFNAPPARRRYLGNPSKLNRKNKSMTACCLQLFFTFTICFIYFYISSKPSYDCSSTDPLCPNQYFARSYNEAREQFISLSSKIHDSKTYNLPITKIKSDTEYGVEQTLYTDITIINEKSTKSDHLLIHISGIHGIEGYAGSAIQCAILSEMAQNNTAVYNRKLLWGRLLNKHKQLWLNTAAEMENENADDINSQFPVVMLIHALNPYGMYHGYRVNENNVDLNRNMKTKTEWAAFNKDPRNKHDNDIDHFLNPDYGIKKVIEYTDWIPLVRFFRLGWVIQYLWSYGMDWYLKTRLWGYYVLNYKYTDVDNIFERYTLGQNYDAAGLQYVGDEGMERSHIALKQFLKERFRENGWGEQFKKITLIDVHTGYGEYGRSVLTVADDECAAESVKMSDEHGIIPLKKSLNHKDEKFANGIYKNVNGMSYEYVDFIADQLMKDKNKGKDEVHKLGLLQHFGTYSREYMLDAVRFSHGYTKEYDEFVRSMDRDDVDDKSKLIFMKFMKEYANKILNDAFYIKELEWKRKVLRTGWDLFVHLYRR